MENGVPVYDPQRSAVEATFRKPHFKSETPLTEIRLYETVYSRGFSAFAETWHKHALLVACAEPSTVNRDVWTDVFRRDALSARPGGQALVLGTGTSWLDYKLGFRMLRRYPGLALAGGLALAIAIGTGAGWYDLTGKIMAPTIPLPEGDRIVLIETQNTRTNQPEPRVVHDFFEWRRELRTIENVGAYRTVSRNLVARNMAPNPIRISEMTAAAFGTARAAPQLGRALLDSDEMPGAPSVVVLGHDVWQQSFGGRQDAVGSVVQLGGTPATVIGVMPKGFAYPVNHQAWTPLLLRSSYNPLDGGGIGVIGRLAPGVSLERANAELRVFGDRTAAALPGTHEHLRPSVKRLGEASDRLDIAQLTQRNLPALLVLAIACMSVGTLIYARTATREGEIVVRSAIGASRGRIMGQLFVEALMLTSVAAAAGLIAADRALTWGIEVVNRAGGGVPFWMTPGLQLSTILYGSGLAVVSAVLLSLLPALKVTRTRLQEHLANRGSGGATLRFGYVWTGAMIVQVALTAIGIPIALETANEAVRNLRIRAAFPSREYLAASIDPQGSFEDDVMRAFESRKERTLAELRRRIAQERDVVAITFADKAPGAVSSTRRGEIQPSTRANAPYSDRFATSTVDPEFFETLNRPIVSGRSFHGNDCGPNSRTVIVNEAFARAFSRHTGGGSPVGARLRYADSAAVSTETAPQSWFEIVGVVRDIGLDPDDWGNEKPFVFHAGTAGTPSTLVMSVRVRGDPAPLAARLPFIAADVDARLLIRESRPLADWIRDRDMGLIVAAGAQAAVTALVLFLSALSIFSLISISVSRRKREIGIRTALGASARDVLSRVLFRSLALIGLGTSAGGVLLLVFVAKVRPAEELALYAAWLGMTVTIIFAASLPACVGPARRALRISPADLLREV